MHFPTFQKKVSHNLCTRQISLKVYYQNYFVNYRLALKYGLKLVKKTRFEDFVREETDPEGLLVRMNVYEV